MERRPRLVSIVIPTYNERDNLPRLVSAIRKHADFDYEILVVDDASPDGTADAAREMAHEHPIRVLARPGKGGLGSAYRDGFAAARGDVIFEMDADLSHDPRHLPALVRAVSEGADVAIGSRYVEGGQVVGWTAYRKLVSGVGNTLAKLALGLRIRDVTSGYRCYTREAAQLVQAVKSDGYAFQVEVLYLVKRSGLSIAEVPITFENRVDGESKLGSGEFVNFLRTLGRLRVRPPTPGPMLPMRSRASRRD